MKALLRAFIDAIILMLSELSLKFKTIFGQQILFTTKNNFHF